MAETYPLRVGYLCGTHSCHLIGCCLISLRSVQRGKRSKITRDILPVEKGTYGIYLVFPLYFISILVKPGRTYNGFEITNNNLSGCPLHPQSWISAVGGVATCTTKSLNAFKRMDLSITDSEFGTIWIEINNLKAKNILCCCAF